jgi:hypothetical protein
MPYQIGVHEALEAWQAEEISLRPCMRITGVDNLFELYAAREFERRRSWRREPPELRAGRRAVRMLGRRLRSAEFWASMDRGTWEAGASLSRVRIPSSPPLESDVPKTQQNLAFLGPPDSDDLDTELEKFTVDSRRSPPRVRDAHLADQPLYFHRNRRPAGTRS